MIVAPSFLTANFSILRDEIESISQAKWLHFDVMDGRFVPNTTYDARMVSRIRSFSNQFFDCHLMIDNPKTQIGKYIAAGAELVTFHVEAAKDETEECIQLIKDWGAKVGISLKPKTPIERLDAFLSQVDLVLVMSVEPGKGGQSFMEDSLGKIAYLRRFRNDNKCSFLIEVDGGINYETAKKVKEAGADVIVSGSYIFNQRDRNQVIGVLENV
ncbi:MAG: ribulose-phosphate 3-epimerase [Candidatus Izemoplasmatales bacterium]|nr:ribulose-phosphate 3-epimerase [Candidatus Izemoplasmatales bacterium]